MNNWRKDNWRNIPLPEYEKYYRISFAGEVERISTGERVAKYKRKGGFFTPYVGYMEVDLTDNDGNKEILLVHYLVAIAFLPVANCSDLVIIHKNSRVADNHVANLEWCSTADYPERLKYYQLNEPFHIRKYVYSGSQFELFDTFNSFEDAAISTKHCLTPLSDAEIANACVSGTCAGVWKWTLHAGSRLPISPILRQEELQNHYFIKSIPDFLRYFVTRDGYIYCKFSCLPVQLLMSPSFKYPIVYLINNFGQTELKFVHHLVANAFIPHSNEHDQDTKYVVNHIDHNKGNPRADNLEWETYSGNRHKADIFYFRHGMKFDSTGEYVDIFSGIIRDSHGKLVGNTRYYDKTPSISIVTEDYPPKRSSKSCNTILKNTPHVHSMRSSSRSKKALNGGKKSRKVLKIRTSALY